MAIAATVITAAAIPPITPLEDDAPAIPPAAAPPAAAPAAVPG
jgi:hypothetical protein